jgi:hypothetical protein
MRRFFALLVVAVLMTACGGTTASVSPDDLVAKFKAAGLEAETVTHMQPKDYGLAPLLCQDGARRFLVPSLGADQGGRLYVCGSDADATKLKTYYDKVGEASAAFHSWTYQKGGVLVQLNGQLDQTKADKYGAVIAALP